MATATHSYGRRVGGIVPGLALSVAIAAAATWVAARVGPSSPLIWAMGLGLVAAPLLRRSPIEVRPGAHVASRTLLRIGVALLGLGISVGQALSVGPEGLAVSLATIGLTIAATVWIGRRLALESDLTLLIAAGTSICGASAIAAASAAIGARRADAGYAIGTVTLFGTVAMLALPLLAGPLGMGDHAAGIWIGASVQEVAQVTAAGAAISATALKTATLVKLVRVAMLAPALVLLRSIAVGREGEPGAAGAGVSPLPLFVAAFLALIAVRSLVPLPDELLDGAAHLSRWLQAAALAGIGLQLELGELRARGPRPLLLGFSASVTAVAFALLGVLALSP